MAINGGRASNLLPKLASRSVDKDKTDRKRYECGVPDSVRAGSRFSHRPCDDDDCRPTVSSLWPRSRADTRPNQRHSGLLSQLTRVSPLKNLCKPVIDQVCGTIISPKSWLIRDSVLCSPTCCSGVFSLFPQYS